MGKISDYIRSLEDVNETTVNNDKSVNNYAQEDEVVIYCKITDFDGLKHAISKEQHDQWEIKTNTGRLRVRKTTKGELHPSFDITYKLKIIDSSVSSNKESTFAINEEQFDNFKLLAPSGMLKDRFFFKVNMVKIETAEGIKDIEVPELVYEVDVFKDSEGNYKEWCKIDLEVNKLIDDINANNKDIKEFSLLVKTINLPFKPVDSILDSEDPVVKKQITTLYDDYFLTKK